MYDNIEYKLLVDELSKYKKAIFQFSGGKDSQAAIEIILPLIKNLNLDYEAVFIDSTL